METFFPELLTISSSVRRARFSRGAVFDGVLPAFADLRRPALAPRFVRFLLGADFLAADLGGLYVLPGGNATIAHQLVERLRATLPRGSRGSSRSGTDPQHPKPRQ